MPKAVKHHITFVIGGARSGKSRHAMELAERRFRRPLYVATAEALDDEMSARIQRHKADRSSRWICVEAPMDVPAVLLHPPNGRDGIVVDCLTLWLTNILVKEGAKSFESRRDELISSLGRSPLDVIVVANEVGLGIVPDTELGRLFRDLAGWLNQAVAAKADQVILVAAGIAIELKGME